MNPLSILLLILWGFFGLLLFCGNYEKVKESIIHQALFGFISGPAVWIVAVVAIIISGFGKFFFKKN
jgi:type IV secretory pathway VirB2 component (pilin)